LVAQPNQFTSFKSGSIKCSTLDTNIFYVALLTYSDLGSSFWGMLLVLASTNLLTARIAAGCLGVALLVVLFIAQNVMRTTV